MLLSPVDASRLAEIKAICYSGLDSKSLRSRVLERLSDHLRADATAFALLDPDTGFLLDNMTLGCSRDHWEEFAARAYLRSPAADPGRLATSDKRVHLLEQLLQPDDWRRDPAMQVLLAAGLRYEVQISLAGRGKGWGHLVIDRSADGEPFEPHEIHWLEMLVPHLLAGLRASLAREAVAASPGSEVGVLTLGPNGRIELANEVAERMLSGMVEGSGQMVFSALELMIARLTVGLQGDAVDLVPAVNVIDRSAGRRYRLSAERLCGSDGRPRALVLIEPARPPQQADALAQCGLTEREAEVALAVLRGEKTKQIAGGLGISPHTVSHHLRHVFEKLGVNSRRQLAAQLLGLRAG